MRTPWDSIERPGRFVWTPSALRLGALGPGRPRPWTPSALHLDALGAPPGRPRPWALRLDALDALDALGPGRPGRPRPMGNGVVSLARASMLRPGIVLAPGRRDHREPRSYAGGSCLPYICAHICTPIG